MNYVPRRRKIVYFAWWDLKDYYELVDWKKSFLILNPIRRDTAPAKYQQLHYILYLWSYFLQIILCIIDNFFIKDTNVVDLPAMHI